MESELVQRGKGVPKPIRKYLSLVVHQCTAEIHPPKYLSQSCLVAIFQELPQRQKEKEKKLKRGLGTKESEQKRNKRGTKVEQKRGKQNKRKKEKQK
jgi:hypothetical protein